MELQTPTHTQHTSWQEVNGLMTHMMKQKARELQVLWVSTRTQAMMSAVCELPTFLCSAVRRRLTLPMSHSYKQLPPQTWRPRTRPSEETELKPSLFFRAGTTRLFTLHLYYMVSIIFFTLVYHTQHFTIAILVCWEDICFIYLGFGFLNIYTHNTMRFSIFLYRCSDATLQWCCNRFTLHTSYMYDE